MTCVYGSWLSVEGASRGSMISLGFWGINSEQSQPNLFLDPSGMYTSMSVGPMNINRDAPVP